MDSPILFNAWKHHGAFIRETALEYAGISDGGELLRKGLLMIGASVIDLYLGGMAIAEIEESAIAILRDRGLLARESYRKHAELNGGYFLFDFPDGSRWTFRTGLPEDKYIHIHPARRSPFTARVKAQSLKTAIAALFLSARDGDALSLEVANRARTEMLGLPPVGDAESLKGAWRAADLLRSRLKPEKETSLRLRRQRP